MAKLIKTQTNSIQIPREREFKKGTTLPEYSTVFEAEMRVDTFMLECLQNHAFLASALDELGYQTPY